MGLAEASRRNLAGHNSNHAHCGGKSHRAMSLPHYQRLDALIIGG